MGLLDKLIPFVGGKVDVGKTADNLLSKLDDSKFTEQEKAMYKKEIIQSSMDFYKLTLNENTTRSKTRRNIAHAIIINITVLFWLCLVLIMKNIEVTKIINLVEVFKFGWAFISVIGFYFGTHLLRSYNGKK